MSDVTGPALQERVAELWRQHDYARLAAIVEAVPRSTLLREPLVGVRAVRALERMGQVDRARALLEELEGPCAASGDPYLQRQRLGVAAGLCFDHGEFEQAEAMTLELITLALQADDVQALGFAYDLLGGIAEIRGDLALALAHGSRGLLYAERAGNRHNLAVGHANLALVCREAGDYALAESHVQRALQYARVNEDESGLGRAEREWSLVLSHAGDHALAEATARRALERFERIGDLARFGATSKSLAQIVARSGRHAEARELIRSALERIPPADDPDVAGRLLAELAEIEAEQGTAAEARAAADRAIELFTRIGEGWQADQLRARLRAAGVPLEGEAAPPVGAGDDPMRS